MSDDILPPNSPEMEKAIIGCMIEQPAIIDECHARFKVGGEVFYDLRNRTIYTTLIELRKADSPAGLIPLVDRLRAAGALDNIGGIAYIAECQDAGFLPSNFEFYADKVSESYMLRRTMATCTEAAASVYENQESADAIISGIEAKLTAIRDLRGNDEIVSSGKATDLLVRHLEARYELQGRRSGIETGLYQLDAITDGLQAGELSIIGARPSQGKTALATTIVQHACITNKVPTLFITLEMSIAALCRRMLSKYARFGMKDLKSGNFDESDFAKFTTFNAALKNSPLQFVDSIGGTTEAKICGAIKRAVKASGVKLVIIDYLQKIHASGKHEKRTYEVGAVSTALKACAVDTGAAIVALAQLSREPDKQKGRLPQISDLADSAQIERDADLIALLHRDRIENEGRDAKLIIAKQRDGELGTCELNFEGRYASFENRSPMTNEQ